VVESGNGLLKRMNDVRSQRSEYSTLMKRGKSVRSLSKKINLPPLLATSFIQQTPSFHF
jgi:hypothetical protein